MPLPTGNPAKLAAEYALYMIPKTRKVLKNRLFVPKSLMIPSSLVDQNLDASSLPPYTSAVPGNGRILNPVPPPNGALPCGDGRGFSRCRGAVN
jgi:hypothetical protein